MDQEEIHLFIQFPSELTKLAETKSLTPKLSPSPITDSSLQPRSPVFGSYSSLLTAAIQQRTEHYLPAQLKTPDQPLQLTLSAHQEIEVVCSLALSDHNTLGRHSVQKTEGLGGQKGQLAIYSSLTSGRRRTGISSPGCRADTRPARSACSPAPRAP
jgi:hypothetical protein